MAESKAIAIFEAQDGFAPSQIMPDMVANEFETVASITFSGSLYKYAIPAALAAAAQDTPQYAESFPIPLFKYIAIKFPNANALYNSSFGEFKLDA